MSHGIQKTEYSILEIFSVSWKYFSENVALILGSMLVVSVPVNLILVFLGSGDFAIKTVTFFTWIALALSFCYLIAFNTIMILVRDRVHGKKISIKKALVLGLKKWPYTFLTSLIVGIILFCLYFAFIIPGIIMSIFWVFAISAVVLNDKIAFDAMKYSFNLVHGRWWKTFAYLIVIGIVAWLISFSIAGIGGLFPDLFIVRVLVNILLDLALAYFVVLSTILFLNFESSKIK